ncbi:hypothetical protein DMA11_06855 [Marinilabiliaceae bacterium JC017]|nr:hypothetical protein DMA11_06855 [Marinilabiliaceae bacterium JC017]
MRTVSLLFLLMLVFGACRSHKPLATESPQKVEIATEQQDTVEYELIVFDPGFETYLQTQPHPQWYYSNEYYRNWNVRYSVEWNIRYQNPLRYGDFYETDIPYDSGIDYGVEFNYRLYHYFQFIEKEYGVVLISRRGK